MNDSMFCFHFFERVLMEATTFLRAEISDVFLDFPP